MPGMIYSTAGCADSLKIIAKVSYYFEYKNGIFTKL
jgi:hypothetical protein